MPRRAHTYHFGRLFLYHPSVDKRQTILDALKAGVFESERKFKYGIFDVQEIDNDGQWFVFGRLVKYKQLLEGEVVNEDEKRLLDDALLRGVVAKSNFLLHYESSVLSFRPLPSRISDRQFRTVFPRLIVAAYEDWFVGANVESIDEDLEIVDAIRAMDIVERIKFEVRPSNPSLREEYRSLQERLREMRAEKLAQTVVAREGGFDKDALLADESYQGIMMATDGYGRGEVHGQSEGRTKVIRTEDSPVVTKIVPSEEPLEILNQLLQSFKRIWERFQR